MTATKKLGILGGMGPAASCNWYKSILEILTTKYKVVQDNEYPEIYLFSLSMDGWSERGIDNEKVAKTQLIEAIKKMELLGVDYIIMACNTAHRFYEDLKKVTTTNFISLISVCINHVEERGYRTVGVISSESTNRYYLYKKKLEDRGIKCITIDIKKEQPYINGIIKAVQSGTQGEKEMNLLKYYVYRMQKKGAQAVILGCTELPLCISQNYVKIPLIDSGYVLLDKVTTLLYENVHSINV